MAVTIIKDGQVVHTDKKVSLEQKLEEQQRIILDLQNQIKDLKSNNGKKTR